MPRQLNATQEVAIILAQMDEEKVENLLRHMDDADAIRILSEMAQLPLISPEDVTKLLDECAGRLDEFYEVRQGGPQRAEKLMRQLVGHQRAAELMVELKQMMTQDPFAFLNSVPPAQIAAYLADEHPQTVALILTNIYEQHAAKVLENMDRSRAAEVVKRMAKLGSVPLATIAELSQALEARLWELSRSAGAKSSGGVAAAAAVLNNVERGIDKVIIETIAERDPDLADRIRDEMFVFEDILKLEDSAIFLIARGINLRDLAIALKAAPKELIDKFRDNISENLREELAEEEAATGPQLVSKIEESRERILARVRELIDSGQIVIRRADDALVS